MFFSTKPCSSLKNGAKNVTKTELGCNCLRNLDFFNLEAISYDRENVSFRITASPKTKNLNKRIPYSYLCFSIVWMIRNFGQIYSKRQCLAKLDWCHYLTLTYEIRGTLKAITLLHIPFNSFLMVKLIVSWLFRDVYSYHFFFANFQRILGIRLHRSFTYIIVCRL